MPETIDATSREPLATDLTGADRALLNASQIEVAVWARGAATRTFHPVLDYDPATGQVRFLVGPGSAVGALPVGFIEAALRLNVPPALVVVDIPEGFIVR